MHIAVYGTLKQGFGNHGLLDPRGFRFVGSFVSVDKLHMTSAGGFPIVYKDQALHNVKAEVYEVIDPKHLSRVDQLEGHPQWYRREPITFQPVEQIDGEAGSPIVAEMYMQEKPRGAPSYRGVRITSGVAEWVRTHD